MPRNNDRFAVVALRSGLNGFEFNYLTGGVTEFGSLRTSDGRFPLPAVEQADKYRITIHADRKYWYTRTSQVALLDRRDVACSFFGTQVERETECHSFFGAGCALFRCRLCNKFCLNNIFPWKRVNIRIYDDSWLTQCSLLVCHNRSDEYWRLSALGERSNR